MDAGALTLASPEVRFRLENDSQDPVDVELKELKDANALVEEFMLLANIYVAKKIQAVYPDSAILRRHPKPPNSNFDDLKRDFSMFGVTLDVSSSKTLSYSLDEAVRENDPYFNKLIRIATTRCMMQAVYFCSGTLPYSEYWHYGLASDIYTHFTSPIRRYADLMVHRLLASAIGYDTGYNPQLLTKTKLSEMCQILNYRHHQAQLASRSSVELYTHLFFKNKDIVEDAYVIKILKNGFNVLIQKYGVEGIVFVTDAVQPFVLQENALVGQVTIKLFDKVKVNVAVEDAGQKAAQRSKVVLRLVWPKVEGLGRKKEE